MKKRSKLMRSLRAKYHLTLGGLIDFLEAAPASALVLYDKGGSPATFDSYSGYYNDLALEDSPSGVATAYELLAKARRADGRTFTGYKGGEFLMNLDTPLWRAAYGQTSGVAIIGAAMYNDAGDDALAPSDVVLTTKEVG